MKVETMTVKVCLAIVCLVLMGCAQNKPREKATALPEVVTIKNSFGMEARFCSNGARLMSLLVSDGKGKMIDVVLGFDEAKDYDTATEPYFGATIGRYGNRIAEGKFILDNKDYQLSINNGPNTLHGGKTGFQYQNWKFEKPNDTTLICTLFSPDGDNGFPGNLKTKVTYQITEKNALLINYEATTDKPTVVNLTNHAFFNLNGHGDILKHTLMIDADSYTPVDSTLIPTGKIESVAGSPFDFRSVQSIGARIKSDNEQLKFGKGYDHNYVLNRTSDKAAATVIGDQSGIKMEIYTEEPGLQFYSGNFMKGENKLRNGADDFRTGFCLETQHFPDSPNQVHFPSTVLKLGALYQSRSIYAFSVSR